MPSALSLAAPRRRTISRDRWAAIVSAITRERERLDPTSPRRCPTLVVLAFMAEVADGRINGSQRVGTRYKKKAAPNR